MTAATATQTAALRPGAFVIYNGSVEEYRGSLFKVAYVGQMYSIGPKRYSLAYHGDDVSPAVILTYVHRESLTRIPAKQVRARKCRDCGIRYTQVAGHGINTGGCPLCALPEVTGF